MKKSEPVSLLSEDRGKLVVSKLALIVFGVVLSLFLLEIMVRALDLRPPPKRLGGFWQSDQLLGWKHLANSEGWVIGEGGPGEFHYYTKISSKGLRDHEYSYEKDANVFRILVLGDSFAAAMHVPLEDAFHEVLERRLNAVAGSTTRFEVISTGVAGYGTDQELLQFRSEGYKYQPDLVVLVFCSNDPTDNVGLDLSAKPNYFVLSEGELQLVEDRDAVQMQKTDGFAAFKQFLRSQSHLYRLIVALVRDSPMVTRLLTAAGLMVSNHDLEPSQATNHVPIGSTIYAAQYTDKLEQAWTLTEALIKELQREVESHGAKLVVLVSTDIYMVHPDQWQQVLETYPSMQNTDWDLDKPNRMITEFLQREGIPYVELTPFFRGYQLDPGQLLFWPRDRHWNIEGHHLAGEVLYDWLIGNAIDPHRFVR